MEFTFFIGIDVSKNELDFAVMQGNQLLFHREVQNTSQTITGFVRELKKLPGFVLGNAVFCMEHTGIYNNHLLLCLHKLKAHTCLEPAARIKNSLGTIRGKNDRIDAIRIAGYAYRSREELRLWAPRREAVTRLAQLAATRSRLIQAKKMLSVALKENLAFLDKKISGKNEKLCSKSIRAIESDMESTDRAIDQLVAADPELKRLFSLVTSVSGIGKVTAVQIIITTNEFKDICCPRKFACYSGVAPFTKDSGIYKGKARVSPMANKKVKMLLHLSALVAIQYNADLKAYYHRKTELEKKNKMCVINAVRNKLIQRIFACVKQNRTYEKNYAKLVA